MTGLNPSADPWRRLGQFLALKRNTALLLLALVVAGTGERFWIGFAPKYLETLGASILIIGLFDALQTWIGAVYAYAGGWLTDRYGQRRSLMLFSALSLTGYVLVLCWKHWLALLIGAFFFLAWSALSLPATFTIVATSLQSHQHTMGIGLQSMVRRIPMMIGPLLGGWLITRYGEFDGISLALIGCIGLAAITMLFQWGLSDSVDAEAGRSQEAGRRTGFLDVVKSFSPTLRELLICDILIRFCERIPFVFVVLWAMDHAGLSARQFGVLVAIEMVTAMICYIPVAHLAEKHGRGLFVLATFLFFSLFPLTLLWATNFGWLAFAFVIRGLKEFGEPVRKAMIIGEAVPELRARTYGAYYLIRDCVVTAGSFLGAWLWHIAPAANFGGAALFGLAGTLWFYFSLYRPGKKLTDRSKVAK
jgi:MFS family permease